jgi:hypothetical protein
MPQPEPLSLYCFMLGEDQPPKGEKSLNDWEPS